MSLMLLSTNLCPWGYRAKYNFTVYVCSMIVFQRSILYIQSKVFYILWKKNIAVVNYSQNKSNKLLTFFTLPDKWSTMTILHIRKKSKIKLFFLYAYLLINANSQICGAKFFLFGLPMPIFLFLKLGDISGLSTKRKKDVML